MTRERRHEKDVISADEEVWRKRYVVREAQWFVHMDYMYGVPLNPIPYPVEPRGEVPLRDFRQDVYPGLPNSTLPLRLPTRKTTRWSRWREVPMTAQDLRDETVEERAEREAENEQSRREYFREFDNSGEDSAGQ